METPFVSEDFEVPHELDGPGFRLEPLGPQHNERDYEAWTASIDHIRSTPGFADSSWPSPMSLDDNLGDLVRHADDFRSRTGFTYTVLDGDDVIGCVYIYPSMTPGHDAAVRSWVRTSRAELDGVLWRAVMTWLADEWPFTNPEYDVRS